MAAVTTGFELVGVLAYEGIDAFISDMDVVEEAVFGGTKLPCDGAVLVGEMVLAGEMVCN